MSPRPRSLAEVAARAVNGQSFELELADLLHEFARCGEAAMLTQAPVLLRECCAMGAVYDAYLAAVAVSFAAKFGCVAPAWAREPERIFQRPWFASPGRHMRALLLVESPAPFRERNLFVSANALSVA